MIHTAGPAKDEAARVTWPAVQLAQRRNEQARVPFFLAGQRVGSVARQHLPVLARWPAWLQVRNGGLVLDGGDPTAALAHINTALRVQGLVLGWRDESYAIVGLDPAPDSGRVLARTERAAARFWGTLTLGAHANGFVADATGRPTHLWVARRALSKATDPGLLDNLVGGGVPDGQTPWQTLVREGWEEAGLPPAVMTTARAGRVIRLHRDVAEGLQLEDIHSHDLQLPQGLLPANQDGEVAGFECLPVQQALACAATGQMTVDTALVVLDFALRHGLCATPAGAWQLMRSG